MVARLDKIKDQETLIKAFALVSNPSWQLHLIGDGPSRGELEHIASQSGLDTRSVFLGRRLDILRYLIVLTYSLSRQPSLRALVLF